MSPKPIVIGICEPFAKRGRLSVRPVPCILLSGRADAVVSNKLRSGRCSGSDVVARYQSPYTIGVRSGRYLALFAHACFQKDRLPAFVCLSEAATQASKRSATPWIFA
jgi:hypothetical protein